MRAVIKSVREVPPDVWVVVLWFKNYKPKRKYAPLPPDVLVYQAVTVRVRAGSRSEALKKAKLPAINRLPKARAFTTRKELSKSFEFIQDITEQLKGPKLRFIFLPEKERWRIIQPAVPKKVYREDYPSVVEACASLVETSELPTKMDRGRWKVRLPLARRLVKESGLKFEVEVDLNKDTIDLGGFAKARLDVVRIRKRKDALAILNSPMTVIYKGNKVGAVYNPETQRIKSLEIINLSPKTLKEMIEDFDPEKVRRLSLRVSYDYLLKLGVKLPEIGKELYAASPFLDYVLPKKKWELVSIRGPRWLGKVLLVVRGNGRQVKGVFYNPKTGRVVASTLYPTVVKLFPLFNQKVQVPMRVAVGYEDPITSKVYFV